jgi:prepilin-type N-terminal cleavage/methylation domain-containing protein
MNSGRLSRRSGFTLIEVIVALGIAGGSLILLLSASRAALQRSMRAQHGATVEQACESKLNEIVAGLETSPNGDFDDLPGLTWHVQRENADVEKLTGLELISLSIRSADGGIPARTVTTLKYKEAKPK